MSVRKTAGGAAGRKAHCSRIVWYEEWESRETDKGLSGNGRTGHDHRRTLLPAGW